MSAPLRVGRAPCVRMHVGDVPATTGSQLPKTIHLLRHGQTEMNAFLSRQDSQEQRSSKPKFEDPLYYDTKLTAQGREEAFRASSAAQSLNPAPEVILSSPLSRALQTADLTFDSMPCPRLAVGLARERTYFASDVGMRRSELAARWPHWSFEDVAGEVWWLDHCPAETDPRAVIRETEEHFKGRMAKLKQYLLRRPEGCIALVVHRDVVELLAGQSPANCEFVQMSA